jgi:hypothetical protein
MRFSETDLDMMHPGMVLFGLGERLGILWQKMAVPPGSWPWQEYKESETGGRTPTVMRSSARLSEWDMQPKKPRNPAAGSGKRRD